uniref:acylphosphatase n=1 Tax=Ciona intestinalis TaxID=7719 RepID=F6SSS2_CIOIN|nr:acylphosphatase-2-like [Ciona intestinalis]|eukprot:XP_002121582.2 acylphosphatase-2-like [Ciona intestinalis]
MGSIKKLNFEVCGKVQGVFFRKHTKKTCDKHGVAGWVLNTKGGTVQGFLEGSQQSVSKVKNWLKSVGSPKSRIDKCTFYNECTVDTKSLTQFSIITEKTEVERRTFKT